MQIVADSTFLIYFAVVVVVTGVLSAVLTRMVIRWWRPPTQVASDKIHQEILARAEAQSQQLLEETRRQAQEIVKGTTVFTDEMRADLTRVLQESVQELAARSDEKLQQVLAANDDQAQAALQQMEQTTASKLGAFTAAVDRRMAQMEEQLAEVAQSEQQKLRDQVAEQKKMQLAALEQKLIEKMPDIVAAVAGRAIPLKEHERLVQDELVRLEKEGWEF